MNQDLSNQEWKQYAGKKILVTGATGFTGRVLTHKLAKAGAKLRIIARESSDVGDLDQIDAEWFRGEVYDQQLLEKAADGVNYIFHLAAAFRETLPSDDEYRKVHLFSTQVLAKAVLGQPEFERFLHVSTVGVHGHIEDGAADEDQPFAPGDPYQRTKLEAEQWIAKFAEDNGLPYSIIRPGPIFGPGDMRLLKVYRMVNRGFFLMLGKGKGLYSLIHVEDLTNIMLLAASSPEAAGEVFIAAGGEAMPMVEMARMIAAAFKKRVRIIRLPLWPFYMASDLCVAICKPLGVQPFLYRRRVDFYTKDRAFNNAKVRNLLGYDFVYDNKTAIVETANWYKQHNHLG